MGPLLQATLTVPIVFCSVTDPVGAGFVESSARPSGARRCAKLQGNSDSGMRLLELCITSGSR